MTSNYMTQYEYVIMRHLEIITQKIEYTGTQHL